MPPLGGAVIRARLVPEVDNRKRPFQFGLSSLLLVITFAAIFCSIIKMNPGIGIVVAMLAAPAMLRTIFVAFRRQESGNPMSTGGKVGVFLITMAMVVCLVVAGCTALCAAFLLTCATMMPKAPNGGDMLTMALVFGAVAAAATGILVTLVTSEIRRRRRSR
jgi:peptidoglycan biosynthesis protein MviN/MurJ (putative lipid II flippase)